MTPSQNARELMQQRADVLRELRELLDCAEAEKRGLTAEEKARYDAGMRRADELAALIERVDRPGIPAWARPVDAGDGLWSGRTSGPWAPTGLAGAVSLGEGAYLLAPEQRMADLVNELRRERGQPTYEPGELSLARWLRGVVTGRWDKAERELEETRAMSVGVLGAGGYLVPEPLAAQVIDLVRNKARVLQAGAVTVTMESHTLRLARVTGDPTAAWKAENAPATASDMTLDAVELHARTLMALIRVSRELVEDSAPAATGVIEGALAAALALELDRACLYGSGTGEEPRGIRNTTGIGIVSMGDNGAPLTDFGPFVKAVTAVWESNGEAGGAIYAPRTAGEIEALADTTGQPLQPPECFRNLKRLVTKQVPVNLVQGTANNASDAFVGDFRQLLIGVRTAVEVAVSQEAADSESSAFRSLQVWLRAHLRADVALAHPDHFAVVVGIIPPA